MILMYENKAIQVSIRRYKDFITISGGCCGFDKLVARLLGWGVGSYGYQCLTDRTSCSYDNVKKIRLYHDTRKFFGISNGGNCIAKGQHILPSICLTKEEEKAQQQIIKILLSL